jgi:hypothetical protein
MAWVFSGFVPLEDNVHGKCVFYFWELGFRAEDFCKRLKYSK